MKFKTKNKTKKLNVRDKDLLSRLCPNCGGQLKKFDGKFGEFVGCENFIRDDNCRNKNIME